MPTFCRHNRLLQNCTICAREQQFEARPIVSSGAPRATQPRERDERPRLQASRPTRPASAPRSGTGAVRVRRLARGAEDGYRSPLVPGLKSSQDAERLAEEIAFSATRLRLMDRVAAGGEVPDADPAWSDIAGAGDVERRTQLAIRLALAGPRGVEPEERDEAAARVEAWAARHGSLTSAFNGEPSWTPERRFERLFERLGGIRSLSRDSRYALLTLLGHLGVYPLRGVGLFLAGENEATWAAKRAFGIADPLLLDRRASQLADACDVPLDALDLALHNWGSGARVTDGLPEASEPDEWLVEQARHALGL